MNRSGGRVADPLARDVFSLATELSGVAAFELCGPWRFLAPARVPAFIPSFQVGLFRIPAQVAALAPQ
jgi:hypothetical protein